MMAFVCTFVNHRAPSSWARSPGCRASRRQSRSASSDAPERLARRATLRRDKVHQEMSMSIALGITSLSASRARLQFTLVVATAIVCAVVSVRALHVKMDAISESPLPLCMADSSSGSSLNKVELISSNALPDLPGKRVTIVRVTYGPGGFTPPHRHAGTVTAYITKGQIKSQLAGGPVEIFDVGQSFF